MTIGTSRMKVAFIFVLLCATIIFGQIMPTRQCSTMENQKVSYAGLSLTYTDHPAISIDGNADFLFQASIESWEGTGTAENPIIVEGYRITDSINEGIKILNVNLHWFVRNCLIDGSPPYACGIDIQNCSNGELSNNIIQNRDVGIQWFEGILNCSFLNNQILNNQDTAFKVIGGMANCLISGNNFSGNAGNNFWMTGGFNYSQLVDNTVTGGQNGIRCLAFLDSVVTGNTVSDCGLDALVFPSANGILIQENTVRNTTGCGIMVSGNDVMIETNTVINSTLSGIYFAFGDNGTITRNLVVNSSDYGLKLGGSTSNTTIIENAFIDNVGENSQVSDDGEGNLITYNHYSDWISPDADANGIVDEAYSLAGEASNFDPYPIVDSAGIIPTSTTSTGGLPVDLVLIASIGIIALVIAVVIIVKKR